MLQKTFSGKRVSVYTLVFSSLFLISILSIPTFTYSSDACCEEDACYEDIDINYLPEIINAMQIDEAMAINASACDMEIASIILGTGAMLYGICATYAWEFPFNMQYCVAGTLMFLLFAKVCL